MWCGFGTTQPAGSNGGCTSRQHPSTPSGSFQRPISHSNKETWTCSTQPAYKWWLYKGAFLYEGRCANFTVSSCGIPMGLFCFCCPCTRHTYIKRQMLKENSEFWATGYMYVSFRQSQAGLLSQECYFSPNPPKSTFHHKLKERKRESCWNFVQAWISQTWPRLKAQRLKPFVYVDMVNYL